MPLQSTLLYSACFDYFCQMVASRAKGNREPDQPQPHAVVDGRTSSLGYRQSVMEIR